MFLLQRNLFFFLILFLSNKLNKKQLKKRLAILLIEDQPIPQVIFKGKPFEDTYTIRLITSPNFEVQSITKIQASLVSEERSWKTDKPMENCEVVMDLNQKTCTFSNLKVNVSTRVSMVHFRFTAQINHKNGRNIIQSPLSYPVIVITNESQWCEAEGKLILLDSFGRKVLFLFFFSLSIFPLNYFTLFLPFFFFFFSFYFGNHYYYYYYFNYFLLFFSFLLKQKFILLFLLFYINKYLEKS